MNNESVFISHNIVLRTRRVKYFLFFFGYVLEEGVSARNEVMEVTSPHTARNFEARVVEVRDIRASREDLAGS